MDSPFWSPRFWLYAFFWQNLASCDCRPILTPLPLSVPPTMGAEAGLVSVAGNSMKNDKNCLLWPNTSLAGGVCLEPIARCCGYRERIVALLLANLGSQEVASETYLI
ncbi:unknown protein [Desulfotalea psychrophila LSv54]|uniref:Uncharacterized protein n=2 Tax=Desulfotalea psychrophila TaxID=84980 RepID=Q6AKY7_DESPS|nr:unknown protein [Desulfotalea psychrophila LSv54]